MDKTLLILGGSSDMAMEYISRFYDRYDSIIAQYHSNREPLEKINEHIGGKITLVQADLSNPASTQDLVGFLKENSIHPSYVLHFPAGKTKMARLNQFDRDELYREMEIEVVSILTVLREVTDYMQEQQFGRICFMLSSVTKNAVNFQIPYVVTKYALLGAMKALAVELIGKNITVNAVSPTMIDTKFVEDVSPFVKKKMLSITPTKRLAKPGDIVGAIALFLADDNEYITGENLLIGGGA